VLQLRIRIGALIPIDTLDQPSPKVRSVPEAEVIPGILNVGYRECWPLIFITRGTLYKPPIKEYFWNAYALTARNSYGRYVGQFH
jgi:hypothetical protein